MTQTTETGHLFGLTVTPLTRGYGDAEIDELLEDGSGTAIIDTSDRRPIAGRLMCVSTGDSYVIGRVSTRGGKWYVSSLRGIFYGREDPYWVGCVVGLYKPIPQGAGRPE